MKTLRMTAAQALVKFLDSQYVEFDGKENKFVRGVFTVFGHGNVLGLGQALEQDRGSLIVHQGRNEQGMAHAAIGFAKQMHRKQIYACTSSVGPGAANMVTAAATASANRIPVLFLPGDTFASRQPDPVLQQVEHFQNLHIWIFLNANAFFRTSGSLGYLFPTSEPVKPASAISLTHCSKVFPPPSSGISSFVHAIGAIPSLTCPLPNIPNPPSEF